MAAGCGDDDGGGDDPDAAVDEPDAEVPDAMLPTIRSGTFGIFEAEITNNLANSGIPALSGSAVSAGWDDLTTGNIEALDLNGDGEPDSNIGGCAVKIFDKGASTEPTETDEGEVTVAGTSYGSFTCSFGLFEAGEYGCQSDSALAAGTNPTGNAAVVIDQGAAPGGVAYQLTAVGTDFDASFIGQGLTVAGFPDNDANGTFQVVGVGTPANSLVVINPVFAANGAGTTSTLIADGSYETSIGETANLVPGGFDVFLGGDGDPVTVTGPVNGPGTALVQDFSTLSVCPATGCEFDPNGEGLVLDGTASVQPEALPDLSGGAQDLTFTCEGGDGGVCGDFDGGALNAIIVSIESTDATTVGGIPLGDGTTGTLQDILFPSDAEEHADIGVTIQCGFIGMTTGTVPQAAVQAMLDAHSNAGSTITRFKTQVLVVSGVVATNDDNQAQTPIFVGHGVVGFSTP